jgi:Na+-transporting methylmalonyl-CoA/oxaloacetate decarboxylase gamma subunit
VPIDDSTLSPVVTVFIFLAILFGALGVFVYYVNSELRKQSASRPKKAKKFSKKRAEKEKKKNRGLYAAME